MGVNVIRGVYAFVVVLLAIITLIVSVVMGDVSLGSPRDIISVQYNYALAAILVAVCLFSLKLRRLVHFIAPIGILYCLSQVGMSYHYSVNGFRYYLFGVEIAEVEAGFDLETACYRQGVLRLSLEGRRAGEKLVLLDGVWPLRSDSEELAEMWPRCSESA